MSQESDDSKDKAFGPILLTENAGYKDASDPSLEAEVKEMITWWQQEQGKLAAERDKRWPNKKILNGAICALSAEGRIILFSDSHSQMALTALCLALQGFGEKYLEEVRNAVSRMVEEVAGIDKDKLN